MKKNVALCIIGIIYFSCTSYAQEIILKKPLTAGVYGVRITSDDSKLFFWHGTGVIEEIDFKTMESIHQYYYDQTCHSFCITPDGKYLTIGGSGCVGVWNTQIKEQICNVKVSDPFKPGMGNYVSVVYITNDGKYVIYRTEMGYHGLLDVEEKTYNDALSTEQEKYLRGFSLDNNKIITNDPDSGNNNLLIANIGKFLSFTKKNPNPFNNFVITTCGNNFITYSFSQNIYQVWDASNDDWKMITQFTKEYQPNPYLVSKKVLYTKCTIYTSPDVSYPRTINDLNTGNLIYAFTMDDCKSDSGTVLPDVFVKPIENDTKLLVVRQNEIRIYDISKLTSGATNTELNK